MSELTPNMDSIQAKYPQKDFTGYTQGGAELYDLVKRLTTRIIQLENDIVIIKKAAGIK